MWLWAAAWAALFLLVLLAPISWFLKVLGLGALLPGWPHGRDLVMSYESYVAETNLDDASLGGATDE